VKASPVAHSKQERSDSYYIATFNTAV